MRKIKLTLFIILLTILGFNTTVMASLPPAVSDKALPSLAPVLKTVLPSVVNISVLGQLPSMAGLLHGEGPNMQNQQPTPNNPRQRGPRQPSGKFASLGSGVIVNAKKGYILTNAHLLRDAKTINVTLNDGRQFKGKLIGMDPDSDVAVVQIKANKLKPLPIANTDNLQVGDFVIAIGSPFGLKQSVTSGIISALNRNNLGIEGVKGVENFIQTDAPINPGNSGGALVNLEGQLIGINTAILAPNGGNVGIGFAIPSNMAMSVMDQLIKYGSVRRGLMGVLIQNLTPEIAQAFHQPNHEGAIVAQVNPHSPAAKAGFQPGDIILEVNGKNVINAGNVTNTVRLLRAGSEIKLKILRHGKTVNLHVVTEEPKQYQEATQKANPLLNGVSLRNIDVYSNAHGNIKGVQIVGVNESSPALQTIPSLRPGDIIVSANQKSVHSATELLKIARASQHDLLLNVIRGPGAFYTVLSKPTLPQQ